MIPLIIYHADCDDGFCSAWVARKALGDAWTELHPAKYGTFPPDVRGREVYILDFSYPLDIMENLIEQADRVVLIDHHRTALENLQPLLDSDTPCTMRLDESKCAAMLTWEYFFGFSEPPDLVKYVQDRDLWRWDLPSSRQVNALIGSVQHDIWRWSDLEIHIQYQFDHAVDCGDAILACINRQVDHICSTARLVPFCHHMVLAANTPVFHSEVGERLKDGHPFALMYYRDGDGYRCSLRSDERGADVSRIAQTFGGGGHPRAAGFETRELIFK